jgi:hypothetical protein
MSKQISDIIRKQRERKEKEKEKEYEHTYSLTGQGNEYSRKRKRTTYLLIHNQIRDTTIDIYLFNSITGSFCKLIIITTKKELETESLSISISSSNLFFFTW